MRLFSRLLFRRRRYNDIALSIQEHLEERIEELVDDGLSQEEATRIARREFGNVTLLEERSREVWQWPTLESVWADARFALRQLKKAPLFTGAALLTLALGIGANATVFSLFDAVLFHPLPYHRADQLLLVTESEPAQSHDEFGVSIQEAVDYQNRSRSFSGMGTFESSGFNLTDNGQPLRVNAAMLSASVFPLLGVQPVLGRTFTAEEDRYGNHHVAVLSWHLWKAKYNGNPGIVGKTIKLDETPYSVIGIMPPSFRFPFDGKPMSEMADLWVPDAIAPTRLDPNNRLMEFGVGLIGRLKPGIDSGQARAEISRVARDFQSEHADEYSGALKVETHTYAFASYSMQKARPLVILLMAAVACVLLIACANVASLLLARAHHRAREMAIRSAIGANRARLMRQCLVESSMLALGGALLGVAVAEGSLRALHVWGPQSIPRLHDATLNPLVLLSILLAAIVTGVLFGLVPAWKLSHTAPQPSLRDMAPIGSGRNTQQWLNAIAITEVAFAVALLIGGGLLVRSFLRLMDTPFGFDPGDAVVVRTVLDHARYADPVRRRTVQQELIEALSHLPGVSSVAAASHLPLSDERQIGIRLEHAAPNDFHWAANSLISPGYFHAMGIPLIRGRDFDSYDRPESVPAAIVSQSFVNQYLHGKDPLGQRFHWGDRALFTVVGVVADVHIAALDADPPPTVYNSIFQVESGAIGRTAFILRGADHQQIRFQEIQKVVAAVDAGLPLYNTTSLAALIDESLAQRKFTLSLLNTFAFCALCLALIGAFGVISYLVEQREQEFGVRMALGAGRQQILALIARQGMQLGGVCCAVGLLLAVMSTRLLRASLYHVSEFDPFTFILIPCLLFCVVVASTLLPARRAASISPMRALKNE